MKAVFDLRTKESAIKFLSDISNVEIGTMKEYFKKSEYVLPTKFLNHFNIKASKINIDSISFVFQHITTSDDDCEKILSEGLMDLQMVLTRDTTLRNFFNDKGIYFNLDNKTIKSIRDNETKILDIKDLKNHHGTTDVYDKIYDDPYITGFLYTDDPKNYQGNVCGCPEIINNMQKYFKKHQFEDWVIDKKTYKLTYQTPFFLVDAIGDVNTFDSTNIRIITYLIKYSLERIYDILDEKYICIKKGTILSSNYLIDKENLITSNK